MVGKPGLELSVFTNSAFPFIKIGSSETQIGEGRTGELYVAALTAVNAEAMKGKIWNFIFEDSLVAYKCCVSLRPVDII